jgi:hypothetical protein
MRSHNLNEAHKKKFVYLKTYFWHILRTPTIKVFISAPRLDFGYAKKPNCLGSAACSLGTTITNIYIFIN